MLGLMRPRFSCANAGDVTGKDLGCQAVIQCRDCQHCCAALVSPTRMMRSSNSRLYCCRHVHSAPVLHGLPVYSNILSDGLQSLCLPHYTNEHCPCTLQQQHTTYREALCWPFDLQATRNQPPTSACEYASACNTCTSTTTTTSSSQANRRQTREGRALHQRTRPQAKHSKLTAVDAAAGFNTSRRGHYIDTASCLAAKLLSLT